MRTLLVFTLIILAACSTRPPAVVKESTMLEIYEKIKTPYKYGIVFRHPDSTKMIDSPSIFRWENNWFMSYIVYDGRGYETWLARSENLIEWSSLGRILSFTDTGWDANQKAGYISIPDNRWKGSYAPQSFKGRYWLSYLGGSVKGYEAGQLGTGIAYTADPSIPTEWSRVNHPVLSATDSGARWYDNKTIFKSSVIRDRKKLTGYPFLMYYNASGDTARYESIAVAGSDDMITWTRLGNQPVISRYYPGSICGDAQVLKIGKCYVMFYFGAFWQDRKDAFERFACSYDLLNWTDWQGPSLIEPSEDYDKTYAHKPFVLYWKGTVYHFYNAVGNQGRVLALATSKKLIY